MPYNSESRPGFLNGFEEPKKKETVWDEGGDKKVEPPTNIIESEPTDEIEPPTSIEEPQKRNDSSNDTVDGGAKKRKTTNEGSNA